MAIDIGDTIEHEAEGTTLDYKRGQYVKAQHEALLKDVLSMANAHAPGERHIVCGVHAPPGGPRAVVGVPPADVVDAAVYQQIVHENIEPELSVAYGPHVVDGTTVTVLRIGEPAERPYAMRKKFGALEHGHMWIRKGTQQIPIRRADLERIYAERAERLRGAGLAGAVRLGFDAPGTPAALTVPAAAPRELPSQRAAGGIRAVLATRANAAAAGGLAAASISNLLGSGAFSGTYGALGRPVPYNLRTTEELEADLARVAKTFREHDAYELYEEVAWRLNVVVQHEGSEPLDAVRLDVEIPAVPDVVVFDRQYSPPRDPLDFLSSPALLAGPGIPRYPSVAVDKAGSARIVAEVGVVRQQTTVRAYGVPVRVLLGPGAVGRVVELACTLHAHNLPRPIRTTLRLTVGPAAAETVEGASGEASGDATKARAGDPGG